MYNAPEISYNMALVDFHESKHDLQPEDISDQKDLLWSVNMGQSLSLASPLSNSGSLQANLSTQEQIL